MEGAYDFPLEYKRNHTKERQTTLDRYHSDLIKSYIHSRRTMHSNLDTNFSLDKNEPDIDIIAEMNKTISLIKKQEINRANIFGIIQNNQNKNDLLQKNLRKISKELIKENIPLTTIKSILNNNVQKYIEEMIELLDRNIQLECLCIINNLVFYIAKYNIVSIDINRISNLLCDYFLKIQNLEEKSSLIEKIYRIFGNLISINNKIIIQALVNKGLLDRIIYSLNHPVLSCRIACLWLLNKIILSLRKLNSFLYFNHFISKDAINIYISLFSRIKKSFNLEEISEFFWLINELAKNYSFILTFIFFSNIRDINNISQTQIENSIDNFSFVLNNSLTNKMFQTSFRLISNLLAICKNEIQNEYLLNRLIECFFEKKNILSFLNDIINSPKNKYDISIVKDAILLIFNLICLSPIKSCIYFKKGIVNLISDKEYQVNKEVMRLLYKTFYRIIYGNRYSFESNDEKVIRTCLSIFKRFREDENMLLIFIDILYSYLEASKTNIDNETEEELEVFKQAQDLDIEKYQYMFLKLANIANKYSPLSKYMRNI